MAQSRKRRSSMSPTRGQPSSDTPEHKKRKPNVISSNINGGSSSSKPAAANRLPVARSPAPLGSDSSTTLDGDTPPAKDKGKAVEKDPLILELERLRKEVAHKNEILEKREKAIAAVTQTLTCQICLELMHKPYALAPCGHVSCHGCLVSWFTSPHNDHEGDEHNPDVEWFSDDGSSIDGHDAHIPWPGAGAGAPANGDAPGNNPNPVDGNVNGNAVPPANGGPAPPAADAPAHPPLPGPAHAPYPNAVHRRKTCPHCRCVVKERPVQVYAIKDLVGIVDLLSTDPVNDDSPDVEKEGGEQKDQEAGDEENDKKEGSAKAKKAKDPWKGIFRPPKPPGSGPGAGHNGNDDDSDDDPGGWPGLGLVGQNAAQFFLDEEEVDEEEILPPLPNLHNFFFGHHQHNHALPLPPVDVDADPALPPPFIDEEDGVRRCGRCMHELWAGECSNEECGAIYGNPSDASDVGGAAPDYGGYHHDHDHDHHDHEDDGSDADAVVDWGFREPGFGHLDDDGNDDGYESSFIDDDERGKRNRSVQGSEDTGGIEQDPDDLAEDPEDDFIPGPSRRWARARQEAIVISSDEDEDAPGPSTGARRRRRRIADEDEDEEEHEVEERVGSIDEGILALDPGPIIHLRGPSSSAGNSLLGTSASEALSLDHGVSAEDDDDEYDGHVPYVWEEEEEEEDGDDADREQDDIVYLHDSDRSADQSADERDPEYAYDS